MPFFKSIKSTSKQTFEVRLLHFNELAINENKAEKMKNIYKRPLPLLYTDNIYLKNFMHLF